MKNKILATLGTAACALALSATASFAGYMQPGETMGVSLLSPLPEGVFFADLEDYGRSDNQGAGTLNAGVNIPLIIWSTPFSFYNTRVEFLGAIPFVHTDGVANQVGFVSQAYGVLLAHDFGGGLTGGFGAILRTPGASYNVGKLILGETTTEIDLRQSLQYTSTGPGLFQGVTFIENASFTTPLSSNYNGPTSLGTTAQNDEFSGDFTIEKTFGKFSFGVVGFGNLDTDNRNAVLGALAPRNQGHVALGGLLAYDFGRFSLTGIVTRDVYEANGLNGLGLPGYETRGWVRVIIPLYVAPSPVAPVVARY
jgi:hypothetical protein